MNWILVNFWLNFSSTFYHTSSTFWSITYYLRTLSSSRAPPESSLLSVLGFSEVLIIEQCLAKRSSDTRRQQRDWNLRETASWKGWGLICFLLPPPLFGLVVASKSSSVVFICRIGRLGWPPTPRFTAFSGHTPIDESYLRFDSNSYTIGVDNHASRCMANSPHLFNDLKLVPQGKQVKGIGAGLAIKGVGTYVMRIQDDNGKSHEIKIPNSLFLPKLKRCLLSPQHWAKEARAKGNKGKWSKTWM